MTSGRHSERLDFSKWSHLDTWTVKFHSFDAYKTLYASLDCRVMRLSRNYLKKVFKMIRIGYQKVQRIENTRVSSGLPRVTLPMLEEERIHEIINLLLVSQT